MFNPNDLYYEQEPLYKPTRMLLKVNELIRGAVEGKLQFFQIRPEKALGTVGHLASYSLPTAADHSTFWTIRYKDYLKDSFFSIDV
jgi:hypothetical protein